VILIPIIALLVGVLVGQLIQEPVESAASVYVAIAALAGLDSVFGGTRSALEQRFQTDLFLTGFIFNILVAFSLVWLGETIGLNLVLAAVVFFGFRLFGNVSLLRRLVLSRLEEMRRKRRLAAEERRQAEAEQGSVSAT
jgi:small basic protein